MGRIKFQLNDLGMTGLVGADILIARILCVASEIADGCVDNSGHLPE